MMKRLLVLLLILCLPFAGCGPTVPQAALPEESSLESPPVPAEEMTAEKVKELFWQTADSGCTVQDCVLVDDGAYGLVGVVQYGQQDEFTHFAFVEADGLWHTVGIGAVSSGEDGLEYLGDGTIGITLFSSEKGMSSYCTLKYSNDGEGNVHFVSSSQAVE